MDSFGFRGEAINSICAISDGFTLTTKTKHDIVAKQYDVNQDGDISK
jgi:DNA mismatch repair ATPase MutL